MICFDTNDIRFNFRSVAVIIQNDHILIHRAADDNFWALPGGRVEFFEYSDKAVEREIFEELGLECSVLRALWHVESFFELDSRRFHEIANYFLVSLINQPAIKSEIDFKCIEPATDLIFRWVPLSKVNSYNVKPGFLKERLVDVPESIEHIKINEINA